MTSAATYSDSLEAWQQALGEAEGAPAEVHIHTWLHCTTQEGVKVWDCGCGERRITNGSPNDASSALREGGSIMNCLFGKARDGMTLPYEMPSGEDEPGVRYRDQEPIYRSPRNPNLGYEER